MAETKAKGTKLQFGNTANHNTAATWTSVAEVPSIKPPKRSVEKIDTTHLESDAKTGIPSIPEVGDLEATIHYDKTQAGVLDAKFGVLSAWRVLYPDGSGRMWTGWISEDGEEEAVNGELLQQTVKIAATGDYEHFETVA